MSGGRRRASAAAGRAPSSAARAREPPAREPPANPPDPPTTIPKSQKKKNSLSAACAADDSREDALAEALGMAEAVPVAVDGNDDGGENNPTPPASPPPPPRNDRAMTLELNREKTVVAKLQAETELLRKQLERLEKEKKRKKVLTVLLPNQHLLLSELPDKGDVRLRREQLFLKRGKTQEVSFDLSYLFHNLVT
jgi:hypothetical protein